MGQRESKKEEIKPDESGDSQKGDLLRSGLALKTMAEFLPIYK